LDLCSTKKQVVWAEFLLASPKIVPLIREKNLKKEFKYLECRLHFKIAWKIGEGKTKMLEILSG